jgi:carbonic anhydrase
MKRRTFLCSALAGAACASGGLALQRRWLSSRAPSPPDAEVAEPSPRPRTPDESLAKLLDGNRRFMRVMAEHRHQGGAWRMALAEQQHPFATVVGCADSRVPPPIVFDQGLGDLFVIREAGHVIDYATLGSIEYAVGHLRTPLVLVLGHQRCGAVTAALEAMSSKGHAAGPLDRLVKGIRPAVARVGGAGAERLDRAVRANIAWAVERVRSGTPMLKAMSEAGEVRVVGAHYHLDTGRVEVTVA